MTGHQHHLQRLPPGPIPLGDDTSFEIFADFPVRFCGQTYDSVWVNANGNLTFGAGSGALRRERRRDADRTAADRRAVGRSQPGGGRCRSFEETQPFADGPLHRRARVPARLGANYVLDHAAPLAASTDRSGFALHGGRFTLDYGTLSATDGLAGYSCGGKVTSDFELETDLSALRLPFVLGLDKPAVYEVFTAADNDLDDARFEVITPKPFRDPFEPNDTSPTAARS